MNRWIGLLVAVLFIAAAVWPMPPRSRRVSEGWVNQSDSGDAGIWPDANADANDDASADANADANADASSDSGLSSGMSTRFPATSAKYIATGTAGNITACDSACTVSFWISPDAAMLNNDYLQHSNSAGGGTCNNSKWYIHGKDTIHPFENTNVYVNVGDSSSGGPAEGQTTTQLTVGAWNHVVFVFDGSQVGNAGRLKIYFNGTAQTLNYNATVPADMGSGGTECALGVPAQSGTPWAPSYIDELAMWNRALSASDVTALYNSGTPTDLTGSANLIAWWRMGDNVSGTTIIDEVSGNNLTVSTGSPSFSSNVP